MELDLKNVLRLLADGTVIEKSSFLDKRPLVCNMLKNGNITNQK